MYFSPQVDLNDNFSTEKHFQSDFFPIGNRNRNNVLLSENLDSIEKY